jgi:esterase/lipase superfamily enzyme
MESRHQQLPSDSMERSMHLWRFGHFGVPILVLPSAAGMAHEWEHNGGVELLRPLIEGGRIKLYCTESNVGESWTDWGGDPVHRVRRHQAFERYVLDELVPFIRADCRTPDIRIGLAGASLGAFYSANLTLKHPEVFFYALCLSGRYDATYMTNGFSNDDIYYSNPTAFVPNLAGHDLERVRASSHLDLVCGRGAYEGANVDATRDFAEVLAAKGISYRLDLWGREASHQPQWWSRQALLYLGYRFGNDATRLPINGSSRSRLAGANERER